MTGFVDDSRNTFLHQPCVRDLASVVGVQGGEIRGKRRVAL